MVAVLAVDRPASDRGGDLDPTTGQPGAHALVVAAGKAAGHQPCHRPFLSWLILGALERLKEGVPVLRSSVLAVLEPT